METMDYDTLSPAGHRVLRQKNGFLTPSASARTTRARKSISNQVLDETIRQLRQTRHSVGPMALQTASRHVSTVASKNAVGSSIKSSEKKKDGNDTDAVRARRSKLATATTPQSQRKSESSGLSRGKYTLRQARPSVGALAVDSDSSFTSESSSSESMSESDSEGGTVHTTRSKATLTPRLAAMSLRTPNSLKSTPKFHSAKRGRPSLRGRRGRPPKSATLQRTVREKLATPAFRSGACGNDDDNAADCEPLPCREEEFDTVRDFIETRLRAGTSGCLYVSGVPGTGKTATVSRVVRALQREAVARPNFVSVKRRGLDAGRKSMIVNRADLNTSSSGRGRGRGRGRGPGRPRKSMAFEPEAAASSTVSKAVSRSAMLDGIPAFKFVELNGIVLSRPKEVYVQLWRALSGKKLPIEKALRALNAYFCGSSQPLDSNANAIVGDASADSDSDAAVRYRMPVVVLVDEIDLLRTRKQEVLYTLFDWPTANDARLIIIAIANLMNLPDTLLIRRVASRLGLARVPFAPYTWQQLVTILRTRVPLASEQDEEDEDEDEIRFDQSALEFVARKVAAISGDVRRALEICKFAIEYERETQAERAVKAKEQQRGHVSPSARSTRRYSRAPVEPASVAPVEADVDTKRNRVTLQSVNRAIARMNCSLSIIEMMRELPAYQKLYLKAILVEIASRHAPRAAGAAGVAAPSSWQHGAVSFEAAYSQFSALCHYEDMTPVPNADTVAHLIVGPLASSRFVSIERPHLRNFALMRLCVNADDLQLALN